jgi:hypothetical protein
MMAHLATPLPLDVWVWHLHFAPPYAVVMHGTPRLDAVAFWHQVVYGIDVRHHQ